GAALQVGRAVRRGARGAAQGRVPRRRARRRRRALLGQAGRPLAADLLTSSHERARGVVPGPFVVPIEPLHRFVRVLCTTERTDRRAAQPRGPLSAGCDGGRGWTTVDDGVPCPGATG